ncbi:MAG TPA: peptidoglycan-binding protein [Syntrophomonadaceae bacterium]|nr:peptidoglycan-binding protein [Syntrophomonadaceae bacterium]
MIYASRFLRLDEPLMQGPDVLYLQTLLQQAGFNPGMLDGIFGSRTHSAVTAFQTAHHLISDGIVGPITWTTLNAPTTDESISTAKASNATTICIDTGQRILSFCSPGFNKIYPVAVGKKSTPSPLGDWVITQKLMNPGGPFGVRWMRLSCPWGGYGIHGTNNPRSIGKAASHGCIRMYNEDVTELYDMVALGTPVSLINKSYTGRILKLGSKGSDVKKVQLSLKALGYYQYRADGHYGSKTRQAVIAFQASQGLCVDGVVGAKTYIALQAQQDIASHNQQP